MARMFCTLEEAAGRLGATEDHLEAMLAEGALLEFRDGANRFLRAADVHMLAVKRSPCDWEQSETSPGLESPETSSEAGQWRHSAPTSVPSKAGVAGSLGPSHKTSRRPSRPGLRSWRSPRRGGLWAGVLDDRPSAILAAFVLMVLLVSALAAGAHFLSQKL